MMTEAIGDAIVTRRHLQVQAGTGTGKSLAYLIPLIRSGKKVVIATATKALQDQLANKDIPLLQAQLEEPFLAAVLKGRSNYICRQKLHEAEVLSNQLDLDLPDPVAASASETGRQVRKLTEWADETATGDRAELDFEPHPRAWSAVSVGPQECPGAKNCPKGEECFAEDARFIAAGADLIIVNTYLYGVHLAAGGEVLPEHEVVVFDEAHQLEDIISSTAGVSVTSGRFTALARNIRALVKTGNDFDAIHELGGRLEDLLVSRDGERFNETLDDDLCTLLELATGRLDSLTEALKSNSDDDDHPLKLRQRLVAETLKGEIERLLNIPGSHVAWIEQNRDNYALTMAPVDVADYLKDRLWDNLTCILTSATISPGSAARLGAEATELDVGSPFNYGEQTLLYCATKLPLPRESGFRDAVADELETLINAAGGRTLALFTSYAGMDDAADQLSKRLSFKVMRQTDLPKPALIEEFSNNEQSCLFATVSFWQGIDIPGPSLSLVTIDKLPFPRPDDPLLSARRDRLGAKAFGMIDLPRTATMLAQGAGRLIRTNDDRGVVAVLDKRLATSNYRWTLINALPEFQRTKDRAEVVEFLETLYD